MEILRNAVLFVLLAGAHGAGWAAACTSVQTGPWNAQTTWGPGGTGCAGAPGGIPGLNDTVTIANLAHTVTVTDNRTVGQVTLAAGNQSATLALQNGVTLTVDVAGAGTGNLTINAPSANGITKLVQLQADSALVVQDLFVTGGGTATQLSEVRVEGGSTLTARDVQLNNNARSRLVFTGAGTLNLARHMQESGVFTCAACTVNLTGAGNQNLDGTASGYTYFNLVDLKTGGAGRFTQAVRINGVITDNGRLDFVTNNPIVTLGGTTVQTIGGAAAITTFTRLTVNQGVGGSVSLGHPIAVNTRLILTAGIVVTGGNTLTLAAGVTMGGGSAASYVLGCIVKNYNAGNGLSFRGGGLDEFPIGIAGAYLPVEITAGTTTTAGTLTVCVIGTDHPQMNPGLNGAIDLARSVNRYWSLANAGLTSGAALDATFKFPGGATEYDPGATPANFIVQRYDGALWTSTGPGIAGATSTQGQDSVLSATNDFAIGEPLAAFPPTLGTFNAFDTSAPAGAIIGNIQTKQAGINFTVRVVRIRNNAVNTGYGNNNVTAELYDASDNSGAYAANACRASWVPIAGTSQLLDFTAGVVDASFTVPNTYRDVRVHIVKAGAGAGEGCSNDRFAIRPQLLAVSGHDATWLTTGTARALSTIAATGGAVHAASVATRPFTLRAAAVPGTATNYDGTPAAAAGFPACCTPPACPGLPAVCTAGVLSLGAWTGAGTRENAGAHYSEAGVLSLQLEDSGYATVDAADGSSAATRTVPSATTQIGRFVPERFALATNNIPQFQTFGSACAARSFTYLGQPFAWASAALAPQVLVTAQNADGGTTTNYRGALFKLVASDVTNTYAAGGAVPFDSSLKGTPVVAEIANTGTGTVTEDTTPSARFAFTRNPAAPDAPFAASITLTVSVQDATEAPVGGNGTIAAASPVVFDGGGPGIAFDGGAFTAVTPNIAGGRAMVFGRARILNALGSEKLALPVPLRTEFWTSTGFVINTADNCTSFSVANFSLGNWQGGLTSANMDETHIVVGGALVAGVGSLSLTAPAGPPATPGSVGICLDLDVAAADATCPNLAAVPPWTATTPADKTWLHTLRTNPPNTYTQDPMGTAAFGLYGSQPSNFIYFRENF